MKGYFCLVSKAGVRVLVNVKDCETVVEQVQKAFSVDGGVGFDLDSIESMLIDSQHNEKLVELGLLPKEGEVIICQKEKL